MKVYSIVERKDWPGRFDIQFDSEPDKFLWAGPLTEKGAHAAAIALDYWIERSGFRGPVTELAQVSGAWEKISATGRLRIEDDGLYHVRNSKIYIESTDCAGRRYWVRAVTDNESVGAALALVGNMIGDAWGHVDTNVKEFKVTEDHLKLIRHLCIDWDDEISINQKRPFGNSDVLGDVLRILAWPKEGDDGYEPVWNSAQRKAALKVYQELELALQCIVVAAPSSLAGLYHRDSVYDCKGWAPGGSR